MSKKTVLPFGLIISAMILAMHPPLSAEPAMDGDSARVLKQFSQFYANARACRFVVDGHILVDHPDKKTEKKTHMRITAAKPNRLELVLGEGDDTQRVITDGKVVTHHIPAMKQYISRSLVLGEPVLTSDMLRIPLGQALFAKDPLAELKRSTAKAGYLGTQTLDGVEHHHIRLERRAGDLDLWIAAGDRPLLRRVKLDCARAVKEQGRLGNVITTIDFSDWQIDPDLGKDRFAFKPSQDDEAVDRFHPPGPDVLVSQVAPDFELPTLDGKKVKLSDLKGKVVVLDFWATWCPPCIKALPTYAKVTGELEKQGVVFYPINLRESTEKIQAFLKEQELELNVLRDEDGSVARKYNVRGIPQSVLIDRQGKIAHVHVGAAPNLEEAITSELKALVEKKPE